MLLVSADIYNPMLLCFVLKCLCNIFNLPSNSNVVLLNINGIWIRGGTQLCGASWIDGTAWGSYFLGLWLPESSRWRGYWPCWQRRSGSCSPIMRMIFLLTDTEDAAWKRLTIPKFPFPKLSPPKKLEMSVCAAINAATFPRELGWGRNWQAPAHMLYC